MTFTSSRRAALSASVEPDPDSIPNPDPNFNSPSYSMLAVFLTLPCVCWAQKNPQQQPNSPTLALAA